MRSTTLREQMMRAAMLTTAMAILLSAGAMLLYELFSHRKAWVSDLRTQARLLATASVAALEFDDEKAAHANLQLLRSQPQIRSAAIYDAQGTLFAAYAEPGTPIEARRMGDAAAFEPRFRGTTLEIAFPIEGSPDRLGTLYLSARPNIWARMSGFAAILVLLGGLSLAAAFLLFGRHQRRITEPLERMTRVAGEVVASHNWTLRAPSTHYRDLGLLVDAFNGLLSECQSRTNELEKQMASRQGIEQELRKADEMKDVFLATLAHELRNPLAPMTSAVALLQMERASQETRSKAVVVLDRQLKHMIRLVNDLLDASRIATGKLSLDVKRLDVGDLVITAVDEVQPLAEHHRVMLRVSVASETLYVAGDAVRLTQVFTNLLNNACRYTPAGGQVDVSISADPQTVAIAVQDTGVGVAPHMQARIFELFEQVDATMKQGPNMGLGVGLTLSRQIVELHQGKLTLASEGQGRGSCFTVHLPRCHVDTPLEEPLGPGDPERVAKPSQVRRLHILIADDNVDLAENFAELLRTNGHQVDVVHDGEAALKSASLVLPDIVLLDIGMPKLDGYQVAKQLKRSATTERIHLVAISGWGQATDKENALRAGFDHHLVKPVDPQTLVNILEDAFEEFAASQPGDLR